MRKRLLRILSLPPLLVLAGCAHQGAAAGAGGYAGMAFGDCEFEEDCYGGPETTPYSCVIYQSPSMPARMAISTVPRHHPAPREVNRGDRTPGSPSTDSSGNASSSASVAPPPAPPLVSREPVVLASPSGEGRTPRTPN
jgi:hypothetical protein